MSPIIPDNTDKTNPRLILLSMIANQSFKVS